MRYTVVGVAPKGFNGLGLGAIDMWLPLHVASPDYHGHDSELWTTDHSSWLRMVARIKPGVSFATATAEAEVLYRAAGPRTRDKELKGTYVLGSAAAGPVVDEESVGEDRAVARRGRACCSLLVAANLINLFVARAAAHMRQTAVRLAIGGGWRDFLRLRLMESFVLGVVRRGAWACSSRSRPFAWDARCSCRASRGCGPSSTRASA